MPYGALKHNVPAVLASSRARDDACVPQQFRSAITQPSFLASIRGVGGRARFCIEPRGHSAAYGVPDFLVVAAVREQMPQLARRRECTPA
jgi:hypothetical protein